MSVAARPAAGLALAAALLACSLVTAAPARAAACPGADATGGPASARAAAVVCLTGQARARAHRTALRGAVALKRSMQSAMSRTGYARGCYAVGENLAWVSVGVTPRQVVKAWLASPEHRANLLDVHFRDTGVASRVVTLADAGRVELWVQHFGTRC